ncbi:MAG: choice-of-anchor D domain-containing protein [Muribaculaceae bacterium]|nr:choice-of-anchor D domain-containing protein [Muribaculaceae bacterium]
MLTKKIYLKLLMSLLLVALAVPQVQAETVTVAGNGGSNYETTVPVYGLYFDSNATVGQTIYSASDLASMVNCNITKITFYPKEAIPTGSGSGLAGVVLQVSLKLVDATQNGLTGLETGLTVCGTHSIVVGETEVEFDFSNNPILFSSGKNLVVETRVITPKGYGTIYWLGENNSYDYYTSYSTYNNRTPDGLKFTPKTTFTYESAAPAVPTITVNPAAVSITTAPNTTGTATFTVTGTNLTNDITLTPSNGFIVTPTTIAAAEAANGVTVTVSYPAPATLETKTGTITLTSDNAETKTVTITAESKEVVYEATVTPSSLNFGEVLVGQTSEAQLVKVSNTGSDAFTPSFSIDNPAFSIENATSIASGTSISYNVTFTPTAAGVQTGVLTVTIGTQTFTVSLAGTGTELAAYDITSSAASGVHNFGDVFVDGIGTWNITLTNNGANAVTPVIEGLAAPFTAENVPATLAAGESATITIKFAPTAIQAYGPTSIVVKFSETQDFQFDYTLRGNGIVNTGTLPPSTYDNIEYTWTDAEGNEHTSKLSEIATDPDQMIALMREVYTNKNLPGNFYRGYNANGEPEDEVAYPAIGKIVNNYTSGVGDSYEYSDAYGWNIGNNAQQYPIKSYDEGTGSSSYHLKYFDPTEYKPNDEGLTLLLVEMRDNEVDDNGNITTEWTAQYSIDMQTSSTNSYSYSSLRNMFGNLFKSVRVVPNSKRVTRDGAEGTLFKVDCDKMNRFFFLAKGRLRKADNSPKSPGEDWWANGSPNLRWRGSSSSSASYSEKVNREPFYQMFEQLSPVSLSNQVNTKDVYQALVNMESYNIEHDCQTIPFSTTSTNTGHEFCLYGKGSISDDCQDVRDLMFFVPDLRMKNWSGRNDGQEDVFVNYYEEYAPSIALYVIRQNAITGEQIDGQDTYKLHLTWDSNLTDFVPAADGVYYIYQVNDDGTYTKVGETDAQTKELYLDVAMQEHGQQVTYVIQGQDNTGFLSLQMSNEESFIIPGTDASEIFQLVPNVANYSRFDPQTVQNFYANGLQIKAYPGANASDYAGKTFNFYRKAATETEWTLIGTAEVNNEGTSATVSMVETTQRQQSEYKFGYKANPATIAMSADAHSYKVFDLIYDNFKADVSANEHPSSYSYKMETADGAFHSNEMNVKVYKTQMRNLTGTFTEEYVENDEVRQDVDNSRQFDIDVEHSSKTDILRYGAYRWNSSYGTSSNPFAILNLNSTEEEDISPQGQASNQGEFYSVYMNGDSYIGDDVYVAQGETGQATFVDDVPATTNAAEEYTYVPVIETFTGRADYNTYGAPMQTTATGKIVVNVENAGKSEYTWEADGNTYRYYNVFVDVNTLDLPEGYEVAKVRAWRKIDASYLNEKLDAYAYRAELDANGEFMFDDPATADDGFKLGGETLGASGPQGGAVYKGTFGALDVENGATVPMKFFVRVYFTKDGDDTPAVTYDPIYVIGDNGNGWSTSTSIGQLTSTDGSTYSGTITTGNNDAYIILTTELGSNNTYWFGAIDSDYDAPFSSYVSKYWGDRVKSFKLSANKTYNITVSDFHKKSDNYNGDNTAGSVAITEASAKAPMLRDTNDGKYYITEVEVDGELNSSIPTSIFGVVTVKEVARVMYYNLSGIESDAPFQGVNIEVTTYTDGSRTSRKIMK